jgi:hypothetical protein
MHLHVRSNSGRVITVEVEGNWKIIAIKEALVQELGIHLKQLILIYGGRTLANESTIEAEGIPDGATIHVAINVVAGAQ